MQAQRTRDTGPETALRRALHARGLRFRLHRPVPGAPRRSVDVAFGPARVAVLVHGCFWHGCPEHARPPGPGAANPGYWSPKIARNRERDAETELLLAAAGWLPLVVWEHEPVAEAADRVERAGRSRRAARTGRAVAGR
jgi:DNA mismatch endonuclease (patch repair protein)